MTTPRPLKTSALTISLLLATTLAISACGTETPDTLTNPTTTSTTMFPGWETQPTPEYLNWSTGGWETTYTHPDTEAVLATNTNYDNAGALQAIARITGDTYFGAWPGFAPNDAPEQWLEDPAIPENTRIRRLDFTHTTENDTTSPGAIWAAENTETQKTAVFLLTGKDVTKDLIRDVETAIKTHRN